MTKQTRAYGTWESPVTPEMMTQGAVGLIDVWADGDDTYWLESRPSEAGRLQIVRMGADGVRHDVLPDGFSARSGVHEYGGGAAWVEVGAVWFVNWTDQRLYVVASMGAAPRALTSEPPATRSLRYADLRRSPDGDWLVCVRETHNPDDPHDVRNELVAVRAWEPSEPVVLFAGSDFVMSPRFIDDAAGQRLRWIGWDHPNMPWNDTTLYEARFVPAEGAVAPTIVRSGGSLMQPVGEYVIDDRSDWWNVWHVFADGTSVCAEPMEAEVGGPAWVFGLRDYVVSPHAGVAFFSGGAVHCREVVTPVEPTSLEQWALAADGLTATAIARYSDRNAQIVRFRLDDPSSMTVLVAGADVPIGADGISRARHIEYETISGSAYGWYYPPTNSVFAGPESAAPPLIVMIHGGPTADAEPHFALGKQFWTSRGFAVVDVNHGGSTGFGRAFRDQLDGQWGIVDVDACCAAAAWLADQGLADPDRLAIRGGSAGGFTVLSALAFRDVFATGTSSYGIADLSALAADTHKFESRYTDRLIGPWPDAIDVYEARSPIHHVDGFTRPLLVFQGLDDMVVPPNQSEMIVAALRGKGIECEYRAYEGEGHGFRKAETIVDVLTHELAWYQHILHL